MKFIINPNAKLLKIKSNLNRVLHIIKYQFRDEANIEITKGVFHAAEIAYKAMKSGIGKIVSVGGDGTLNEILHGIIGGESALGIIPMGSGNDFARTLKFRGTPFAILRSMHLKKERPIDVIKVNDSFFLNSMGTGIDSEVIMLIKKERNYLGGFYKSVLKHKPFDIELTVDGSRKQYQDVSLILFSNGKYFGNKMKVSPNSELDDGKMEIVLVSGAPKLELITIFPTIYFGTHIHNKHVHIYSCRVVEYKGAEQLYFQKDGDLFSTSGFKMTLLDKALKILV